MTDLPELHDPIVVAAFEGWNDAGDAATDAVKLLAEAFGAVEDFEVSPDEPLVAVVAALAAQASNPAL